MMTHNRFALVTILTSSTLAMAAGVILAPVLNLIRDGLHVDSASVGLIITTHALFTALFSPLTGYIIDRIGPKKPFIFGLLLYGLTGGSGMIITSYRALILSRAILGISIALVFNSITVMILNLYEETERNKVTGWWQGVNTFGGVIWPLIGGFLGKFSWNLPFAVHLLGIPLCFLGLVTLPEIHNEKSVRKGSILSVLRKNPVLLAIYSFFFLTIVLLYAVVIFLPQLLEGLSVSNPFYISLFIALIAFSGGMTSLLYGRIRSKLSYKMIALVTFSIWTVAFTVISQKFSSAAIAASVVLCGIGQGILTPAVMVWAGETAAVPFRGRVISYLTTFGYIGQFSSLAIFGPIALWLGLDRVFLLAGGICATVFMLILVGMREQ